MTARQPFTTLCQQLARRRLCARVDLHIHTTCSDGAYTPAEVVDLARRSGMPALAITDHDTIDGIVPARRAAASALEVIAGVELTAQYRGKSFHLLGYFFRLDDPSLVAALERQRQCRLERYRDLLEQLRKRGIQLEDGDLKRSNTLGRRHLAELLVKAGKARTVRDAFIHYLKDGGVPLFGLPVADAIQSVRAAGGVAAWAHPPYDCTREDLLGLRDLGLQAVEVDYPSCRPGLARELRSWARELGLAITGGSDCHGPGPRAPGAGGITVEELERLRQNGSPG